MGTEKNTFFLITKCKLNLQEFGQLSSPSMIKMDNTQKLCK